MRRLRTAILVALLLAAAFATPSAKRAHAEISGPCEASVNGREVGPLSSSDKGDAIKVKKDDTITVVMTSATGFESHKIDMEIVGFRINLQTSRTAAIRSGGLGGRKRLRRLRRRAVQDRR